MPEAPEGVPDDLAKYEARKQARLERIQNTPRKTKAEIKAERMAKLAKATEARKLKLAQRQIVKDKVAQGLPITEQERSLLYWKGGKVSKDQQEKQVLAAAAHLLIKPQSVTELRVLVEKTAAKHSYNPIEELILQTRDDAIPEKEKIAIHKALLPFLVPQLAAPKPSKEGSEEGGGVKVTVTQFVFPEKPGKPDAPIYTEKPATVHTEEAPKEE